MITLKPIGSEGWDVDNVFQIVPMEEKAFNSRLLISQVLGRGMRIPRKVPNAQILQNYPIEENRWARYAFELTTGTGNSVMLNLPNSHLSNGQKGFIGYGRIIDPEF